jgi:hypothetical protein
MSRVFFLAIMASGVLLLGSAQAMQMPGMSAGSPEHDADAFAALTVGNASLAKKDLNKATADSSEPQMARMHAHEALASLTQHKPAAARMHAENGAAVEHFTYALHALHHNKIGTDAMARSHLNEALALAPFKKYAKAALAALGRKDRSTATAATRQGLKAAEMAA